MLGNIRRHFSFVNLKMEHCSGKVKNIRSLPALGGFFISRADSLFKSIVRKGFKHMDATVHGIVPEFPVPPLRMPQNPVNNIAFLDGPSDAEAEPVEIRGTELLGNGFQAVVPGIASAELEAQ